ncbi:MAG TPA: hypothetical protein VGP79_18165, partial [Bryobacteraceae bacterium]|nr:hypothetical protein [Bryobacteraceae bacterium]
MEFLSILKRSKPAAPEVENNSWLQYRPCSTAVVFVHGVLSGARECWYEPKSGTFWPSLVDQEQSVAFPGSSVFLGGYFTEVNAGEYGMRDCSRELLEGLSRSVGGTPAVLDHERLVFVCHSLGGIVTRYMLECWREFFEQKAILLVLVASPSIGSQWANSLARVIELFRNRTGRELNWKSDSLDDLDRRFKEMRSRNLLQRLSGCEWYEQNFPRVRPIFRLRPIVPVDSAVRYFDEGHLIPNTDHMSIVKPAGPDARVHVLLRDAYQRFDRTFPAVLSPPEPRPAAGQPPPPYLFQCDRMKATLLVNEFGDGHLQLHYEKIRVARTGDVPDYVLPPFDSVFGQVSTFLLQTEGSSPGISIEVIPEPDPGHVVAHFDPAPSAERPQTLIAEMLGAHTFAMDRKELAIASGGDALGELDNTSITLDLENVRELVFEISLPASMSLTHEPPFVRAYQHFLSGEQRRPVFDSALTLHASENLYYSRLLRTIFITVKNPPQRTSYHVYWRLGDPLNQFEAPTPRERARLTARRNALHSVRESFAAPDPASETQRTEVLRILATLGMDVIALLKNSIASSATDERLLPALL